MDENLRFELVEKNPIQTIQDFQIVWGFTMLPKMQWFWGLQKLPSAGRNDVLIEPRETKILLVLAPVYGIFSIQKERINSIIKNYMRF
jgi:hypothetical protein